MKKMSKLSSIKKILTMKNKSKKNKKKVIIGLSVFLAVFISVFSFINLKYPTKMNAYIAHVINKGDPACGLFKDENFYNAVVDAYNKENDMNLPYTISLNRTLLSTIKEVSYDGGMNVNKTIESVDGIETLTSLTKLVLINNNNVNDSGVKNMNLSNNTELSYLDLNNSGVVTVNLSKNIKLTYLDAEYNGIENIDLSNNIELTSLKLEGNSLTSIDLTKNTKLTQLDIGNRNPELGENRLTSINLSQNTLLTELDLDWNDISGSLDLSNNIKLEKVRLFDNSLTNINISNSPNLTYLGLGENALSNINTSNSPSLTYLNLDNNNISGIDLSKNTSLTYLNLYNNNISGIDLSKNTSLTELYLHKNNLVSIDLSKNTSLTELYLAENRLTSIDLSKNTALKHIYLFDNPLIYKAYVKKGDTLSNSTIKMPDGSDYYLIYENNSSIVSVTNNKVTGISAGKTNVTVTLRGIIDSYELSETSKAISLDGNITVYDVSSTKYKINNDKKYIYTKNDTDSNTILSNLNLQYINGKIEDNKLILYGDDNIVIDEYQIVNMKSNKYDLSKEEYIYLGPNSFNSNDITINNGALEVNDYILSIKYKDEVLDSKKLVKVESSKYDLTKDYINDSNFSKDNITVINGTMELEDNKLYIKYKDEILKTYVISESSPLPTSRLKGDIDNNGVVNLWDVTLLYMHVRGTRVITDEDALSAGKLTGNQNVTLGDVTRLYRYVRGAISEL